MMKQQEKTIQDLAAEVKELKRELKSREVATGD
jgi:ribosomal protein L29